MLSQNDWNFNNIGTKFELDEVIPKFETEVRADANGEIIKNRDGSERRFNTDKIILICTLANRKHWLINLMIYFKMEKIGNSTKTEKKRQGPKTLSFLLYRRPGSNRHVLADTGF